MVRKREKPVGVLRKYFKGEIDGVDDVFKTRKVRDKFCEYLGDNTRKVFDEINEEIVFYGNYKIKGVYESGTEIYVKIDAGGIEFTKSYDKEINHSTF